MESIHTIEIIVNLILQSLGSWISAPANFFSFLGTEEFYLVVMPLLYWCVDAGAGLRISLILAISVSSNGMLKLVFHTPRPYWVDARVRAYGVEQGFGLPSGHAQNAASIWGLAGVLGRRKWLAWACGLVIALIGISRLALGVHFLSDVLLGWALGGLILALFVRLEPVVLAWVSSQPVGRLLVYCLLSSLGMVLLFVSSGLVLGNWQMPADWAGHILAVGQELPNPASLNDGFTMGGVWLGTTAGAVWLFRRWGGFRPQADFVSRALSYLVGLVGVLALWYGLGAVFPRHEDLLSYVLRYLRYVLLGGWVSAGAPWFFKRLGLVK